MKYKKRYKTPPYARGYMRGRNTEHRKFKNTDILTRIRKALTGKL